MAFAAAMTSTIRGSLFLDHGACFLSVVEACPVCVDCDLFVS